MTIKPPLAIGSKTSVTESDGSGPDLLSYSPFGDRRYHAILFPILLIMGLLAAGYVLFYFYSRHMEYENIVQASGRIEAPETHIRAPTATRVTFIAVKEGDAVHKGQLIVTLDSGNLQDAISKSAGSLKAAEQARRETNGQVAAVQGEISQARAKSHGFFAQIFSTKAGRAKKAMQLRTEMMQAKMMSMQAHSALSTVEGARTQAISKLSYYNVTSPIDGVCTIRSSQPGELVAAGQTILSLASLDSAYLRGFVPESDIARLKIGQTAQIFLDSTSTKPLSGRLTSIDAEPSFTPENIYFKKDRERQAFGIKISIDHSNGLAKPGMPARAKLMIK